MRLELTADLEDLSRIRDFVTNAMTGLGVDARVHDDVRLAVDEAVTNVLLHGYRGSGPVTIDVFAHDRDLVVLLSDEAPPFDPTASSRVDLTPPGERENPGGFGVFLIQNAMDDVEHTKLAGGNALRLTKRGVAGSPGVRDSG